jgi:hypothetical protein
MDGEDEEWERKYVPFIVNKCVGAFPDTIMLVNEINQLPNLDKKLQFHFLINSLRPRKRFTPWLKATKLENLEYVKEFYGYNNVKAKAALDILSDDQLATIKKDYIKVGKMEEINWTQDQMLEIGLKEPDDFLKVRETLSRIGVASRKEKKLYQSCHILHKQGRYFIVHFKELFALDGKNTNLTGMISLVETQLPNYYLIGDCLTSLVSLEKLLPSAKLKSYHILIRRIGYWKLNIILVRKKKSNGKV